MSVGVFPDEISFWIVVSVNKILFLSVDRHSPVHWRSIWMERKARGWLLFVRWGIFCSWILDLLAPRALDLDSVMPPALLVPQSPSSILCDFLPFIVKWAILHNKFSLCTYLLSVVSDSLENPGYHSDAATQLLSLHQLLPIAFIILSSFLDLITHAFTCS